jgi:hypothetical protein
MLVQQPIRFRTTMLALAAAIGISPAMAQVPAQPEPQAMAWAMGTVVYRGQHKGRQSYVFNANLPVPGRPQNPGASAAFGVDDAGNVTWLGQTEYQPTQTLATVRRGFFTPKPPLTNEQAPRYLMVCSWPLNDQRKIAGPISVGFAERDDSRTTSAKDGTLQESTNMHWVGVPAARAKGKFLKRDYCGEVANGTVSSAPHWLQDRKEN